MHKGRHYVFIIFFFSLLLLRINFALVSFPLGERFVTFHLLLVSLLRNNVACYTVDTLLTFVAIKKESKRFVIEGSLWNVFHGFDYSIFKR